MEYLDGDTMNYRCSYTNSNRKTVLIENRFADRFIAMETILKTLQDRLLYARKILADKSQAEVAEAVGIKQGTYAELETGSSQGSKYIVRIAVFLGVNAVWLDTGRGPIEPNGQIPPNALFPTLDDAIALIHARGGDLSAEQLSVLQNVAESVKIRALAKLEGAKNT